MRRAAWLWLLASAGCSQDPYFIGEHRLDSGLDAGLPSECESEFASALMCSGFEAEDLASEWGEPTMVNAGEIERSTERAHSGQAALRAASNGSESIAVVAAELEPAVSSGTLYLRVQMYVPAGLPTEIINVLFLGAEPADPFVGLDINLEGGALQIFSPQNNPARVTGELLIPRDAWFCLRAEVVVSDGEGAVRLFVDDEVALESEALNTLPTGGVSLLRAGVDWSSAQEASFEIYMDDLVLDTAPVACGPIP